MDTILYIVLARIIEAYRDAEIFTCPDSASFIWHALKFVQYAFWLLAGMKLRKDANSIKKLLIGVLIAWPIFEVSLFIFRDMLSR